jgi:hypothetical protein
VVILFLFILGSTEVYSVVGELTRSLEVQKLQATLEFDGKWS